MSKKKVDSVRNEPGEVKVNVVEEVVPLSVEHSDVHILPSDNVVLSVPVVDAVPDVSGEPLFFGEVSDRVMWLRDKLGLTPGKEFDVVLLSAVKSWQRENNFMPSGVFPVDEWNVLFNLV